MPLKNTAQSWGAISQSFHWLMALLIFLALALGYIAHEMDHSPEKAKLFVLHKSIGITVLVLAVLRVLWKLWAKAPGIAAGISRNNERLAQLGQFALYGLMFALPLTGWVINSAANIPFKWMNFLVVPNLPGIQESWRYLASVVHWYLSIALVLMVLGHGGMAILHHCKQGSNVLTRMLPPLRPWRFALGFCLILVLLSLLALKSIEPQPLKAELAAGLSAQSTAALDPVDSATRSGQQWQILSGESSITFVATYDGAPFEGAFKQFAGTIAFDPEQPQQGYFDVHIDTGSVTTYTDDWDQALPDKEWFFVARYPQAHYQAGQFDRQANGYIATGALSLKGIVNTVPLQFTWKPVVGDDARATLVGSAALRRTDFNIGAGEWAADSTVGFGVKVNVDLILQKK